MIISFGGTMGSGKSHVARRLAEKLGWPYYDMGKLHRDLAAKRGLTLEEFNKLNEADPTIDREVDQYQAELGKKEDNFIMVGRTSWHFIPHSIKIFMTVRLDVGARRIFKDLAGRNEAEGLKTVEDVQKNMEERIDNERSRYKKHFNIDVYDERNYDYVIDTSDISEDESFAKVCAIIEHISK
jgi:cytidylate kinase